MSTTTDRIARTAKTLINIPPFPKLSDVVAKSNRKDLMPIALEWDKQMFNWRNQLIIQLNTPST